jgi:GTP-binding protein EngB required for normal cell division
MSTTGLSDKLESAGQLSMVADVVRRFDLAPLQPMIRACETLSIDESIDLAVLGQFKSGKSSLLNSLLGEDVLPVGALPLTAVITRVAAGEKSAVRVTHLDGQVEQVVPARLAEFVTEAGNPGNHRRVAVVDVLTPRMRDLPDIRLVDTPGLGSVFAHNTEATRAWMPNIAAAIVSVSAERPMSNEDLRLVADARKTAPRVVVLLTKVDLLSDAEREQVIDFIERSLRQKFDVPIPVLPFSVRVESERWLRQLRKRLLLPVARNIVSERRAALTHKLITVTQACLDYLSVGMQAAERTDADRERLRAAVFNETVSVAVIRDELALAEQGARASIRPVFEKQFVSHHAEVQRRLAEALAAEMAFWQGSLAKQARRYEEWMKERLLAELMPLSNDAVSVANQFTQRAEDRFRRIVEAFRDRLNRNIREATGITVSPVEWEAIQPELAVIPFDLGRTFMVHWDLLWWLLPMKLVGGIFRRHALRQVSREVEKNLRRLVSDWTQTVNKAVSNLNAQANFWVESELNTLNDLLAKQPNESPAFHHAIQTIERLSLLRT